MVTLKHDANPSTPTPSPLDPALKQQPQANVRRPGTFDDAEFVSFENVPVFAEHTTTARDGRQLKFGPAELQAVCNRCNRRIQESGDYAALSLGHTPDPDQPGEDPEIIGFAGPFRMGTVGQPGQRQRAAILADFHVFREDAHQVRKHPRRSPEVWLEESYEEMFLDPIALLSSQAPRLDMGLLYSAQRHGRVIEKYTAVAPAAGNVCVRSDDFRKPSRDRYAAAETPGDPPMLTPEDIGQIVDAMEQLDWVQGVKALLAEQQAPAGSIPAPDDVPPSAPPSADPAPPPAAASPPPDAPAVGAEPPAPAPPAPDPPDATPPAAEDPGPPEAPAADEESEEYCGGPKRYEANANATGEYQTADQREDMDGAQIDHQLGTDKQNYAALDAMDDDKFEDYARNRRRRRKSYSAEGSADEDGQAKEGSVEPDQPGPMGDGSNDDTDGESTGEYQKARPPAKFDRAAHANRLSLESLQEEVSGLRNQLRDERATRVNAQRYSALSERRQHFAFELDDEVARCTADKMSPQQFNDHLQQIERYYRRVPVGEMVAAGGPQRGEVVGPSVNREKYDKKLSDRAREICEARAVRGQPVDYADVLAKLHAGEAVEV